MADGVGINTGAGATIATDEVQVGTTQALAHTQFIKLVDGTLNGTDPIPGHATRGLRVDDRSVSTRIQVVSAGLTIAATAYTSGDQVGTSFTFANATRESGGFCKIENALLTSLSTALGAAELWLFDRTVTPAADNAANAFSDADILNLQGIIQFPAPLTASANNSTALATQAQGNLPILCKSNAQSLIGYLVTRSANSFFTAVGDLIVTLMISQVPSA